MKAETILAPLVDAADALSGARPGARREMLESYVRRLEDLERISNSFKGVEKSFAVQAGREIRIIVEPGAVPTTRPCMLAREVARKIESEMTYPGADQGDGHPRDPRLGVRRSRTEGRCVWRSFARRQLARP